MWVYRTGRMYTECQIVLYEYQRTRNASHPREFLKDFSGVCVTDGYQVYHTIEEEREDLKIAGCWSHYPRSIVIPDDENAWRKRPVKSRVCGTWTCKLQQIYNNFTTHNEE